MAQAELGYKVSCPRPTLLSSQLRAEYTFKDITSWRMSEIVLLFSKPNACTLMLAKKSMGQVHVCAGSVAGVFDSKSVRRRTK